MSRLIHPTARRLPVPSRAIGRALLVTGLAVTFALVLAGAAHAGTVRVSQCNAVDAGGLTPRGYQADLWSVSNGEPTVSCGAGGGRIRIDTANHRLLNGWSLDTRFGLPDSMPHSGMRAMWLDWTAFPQAPSTNPAYIVFRAGGARVVVALPGWGTPPGAAQRVDLPAGARSLDFGIWCSPVNGPGWCNWAGDLLELRGLTVEVEENGEPAAELGGALLAAGAHTGIEPLEVSASDGDSGVRSVAISLGGVAVGSLAGGCRDDRLPPCPQALHGTVDVDTRRAPDGPRRLRLVVTDAAGNARTIDAGAITVANQPHADAPAPPPVPPPLPVAVTPPAAPPGGPGHDGAAAVPFPPNPLAGRGHVPNGIHAGRGARVTAWLELSRGRRVLRRRAVTVPPGVRVRIRGRVRDRRGRPIGGATLAAYAREPGDVARPITGVRTRPNGRFTAFTRIGPSRTVRFVYYPFGDSTQGVRSPALKVTVRRVAWG